MAASRFLELLSPLLLVLVVAAEPGCGGGVSAGVSVTFQEEDGGSGFDDDLEDDGGSGSDGGDDVTGDGNGFSGGDDDFNDDFEDDFDDFDDFDF